jgi:PTH1 family peptidyl-tRNA hydrolase
VRLVVGLGNPGREYERTRHNAGFMVVDELERRFGVLQWRTKDSARQAAVPDENALLVEPQSFMNLSGAPVRVIASWHRTPPEEVLVIADDMDIPFGKLRMRPSGGHGGHNGLRSIIGTLGGENFPRLRFGVGRPDNASIDHVLSSFTIDERERLPQIIAAAATGVERWLKHGIDDAMRFTNVFALPE